MSHRTLQSTAVKVKEQVMGMRECELKGAKVVGGSRLAIGLSLLPGSVLLSMLVGCGIWGMAAAPLATVESVDLERYQGVWYEIARYPNWFERDCVGTTARYTLLSDGRVEVVNTCSDSTLDGPTRDIRGSARSVDPGNAKLKVSFFGPFEGDYWILDLGEDYEYSVVGEPTRNFFWILSRTPTLDEDTLDMIIEMMPEWGYEPSRLYYVPQAE
jgi:apolipoprotein D and lipocalin family protein